MIDFHYHLRNRMLNEDIKTLKENIKRYDLEKVITLATYFPKQKSGLSNYRLLHAITDIDKVFMLASLDFDNYFYMHYNELIDLVKNKKVLGVKIYTGYQNIDIKSEEFKKIMDLFEGKIVMFHTGYCNKEGNSYNPEILKYIFKKYKKTNFILAHLGNPFTDTVITLINENENVYTDISGLVEKESDWERAMICVSKLKKIKNKEKILFGTDFPVQSYQDSIKLIEGNEFIMENKIC